MQNSPSSVHNNCCIFSLFLFIFVYLFCVCNTQSLRVGVLESSPIASRNETTNEYDGFGIDVWNQVVQNLNSNTYTIDSTFVSVASMYDMANLIFENQIDVVIYGIVPPPNMYRVLNSSVPYLSTVLHTIALVSTQQTTFELVWNVFVDPTFLAVLLIISLFSIVAAHIIWTIERQNNADFSKTYKYGIGHSLYWAWSTISLVGFGDVNPKSGVGKGFTVFIVMTSLILLNIFSGIVCSYVTTNSLEPNPPTRDAFSGVPVAALNSSYAVYFLQVVNAQIVEVSNVSDGIALVKNSTANFFVADQSSLLAYNNTDAAIELSGPSFDNLNFTFLYSSLSGSLARDLDRALTLLQFTPTYKLLKDKYFPITPTIASSTVPNDKQGSDFVRVWLPTVIFMGAIVFYFLWLLVYHLCCSKRRKTENVGRAGRKGDTDNSGEGSKKQDSGDNNNKTDSEDKRDSSNTGNSGGGDAHP